jgi:hypothetical protein
MQSTANEAKYENQRSDRWNVIHSALGSWSRTLQLCVLLVVSGVSAGLVMFALSR